MKKTPLNNIHHSLGAKMGPFAGYEMPIQYSGVKNEHTNVRSYAGIFDISHMGEFIIEGINAMSLLQKICSNDIKKISIGKAQYNCFPNYKGGIIDDLIVYCIDDNKYLLVVNASNIEKDWKWIKNINKSYNAKIKNISYETSLIAIQGPKAIEIAQFFTSDNLASLENYSVIITKFCGVENVIISTTGYTGSGGIEICCNNKNSVEIWETILKSDNNLIPIGLAARDSLRIEMGYCLYGNEINESISPIMAGLGWITKPLAGCISAEKFRNEIEKGTDKKLVGFEILQRGIPRNGYHVFNSSKKVIGYVTSGTHSTILNKGIGLGYVDAEYKVKSEVYIEIRTKKIKALIVELPFIKKISTLI